MNKNLNLIAKELFAKIRTSFPEISLKDKESETTGKPSEARFFDFDYAIDGQNLGRITIHLAEKDEDEDGDKDGLTIIYSNAIVDKESDYTKKNFYKFLKELREFAKQKLLMLVISSDPLLLMYPPIISVPPVIPVAVTL